MKKQRVKKERAIESERHSTVSDKDTMDAANSGGQSGDTQGLSDRSETSESVAELLDEGQPFEAEAISGIENAPDADQGEVRVHERREDSLSPEYRGPDLEKDVDDA